MDIFFLIVSLVLISLSIAFLHGKCSRLVSGHTFLNSDQLNSYEAKSNCRKAALPVGLGGMLLLFISIQGFVSQYFTNFAVILYAAIIILCVATLVATIRYIV